MRRHEDDMILGAAGRDRGRGEGVEDERPGEGMRGRVWRIGCNHTTMPLGSASMVGAGGCLMSVVQWAVAPLRPRMACRQMSYWSSSGAPRYREMKPPRSHDPTGQRRRNVGSGARTPRIMWALKGARCTRW